MPVLSSGSRYMLRAMDFSHFKLDIDDLIKEFSKGELKTLSDMKKLWLERKFSYIFDARPSTGLTIFMQCFYSHTISHMAPTNSLSQRLGALYVLYCLYETQPFKPLIKIYLSLGELRQLKALVVNAKEKGIKVASVLVKRMLDKNAFLFGFVNTNDYSDKERIKELVNVQNACIKKMHEKLLANNDIERHLHLDMGMELDLEALMKMSKEYEETKNLAIREASQIVDVQNINHITEDRLTVGDEVQKINEEWGNQKEMFLQLTRTDQHPAVTHTKQRERSQERSMLLHAAEQQQNDDELQQTRFMELLLGNQSPEAAHGNAGRTPNEQHSVPGEVELDDDLDYAMDLENELFRDFL